MIQHKINVLKKCEKSQHSINQIICLKLLILKYYLKSSNVFTMCEYISKTTKISKLINFFQCNGTELLKMQDDFNDL